MHWSRRESLNQNACASRFVKTRSPCFHHRAHRESAIKGLPRVPSAGFSRAVACVADFGVRLDSILWLLLRSLLCPVSEEPQTCHRLPRRSDQRDMITGVTNVRMDLGAVIRTNLLYPGRYAGRVKTVRWPFPFDGVSGQQPALKTANKQPAQQNNRWTAHSVENDLEKRHRSGKQLLIP